MPLLLLGLNRRSSPLPWAVVLLALLTSAPQLDAGDLIDSMDALSFRAPKEKAQAELGLK